MFTKKKLKSTIKTGKFYCAECRSERSYGLAQKRDLLYFFGIPVMPLKVLGLYVFCATCKTTYKTTVLHEEIRIEGQEVAKAYEDGLVKVMAHILVADGEYRQREEDVSRNLFEELTGVPLARERFEAAVASAKSGDDVYEYLFGLQDYLSDQAKFEIVRVALIVAFSDDEFHQNELAMAAKIGSVLGLNANQIHDIISSLKLSESQSAL